MYIYRSLFHHRLHGLTQIKRGETFYQSIIISGFSVLTLEKEKDFVKPCATLWNSCMTL